ncbi:hypothetical protein Pla22_50180 [Rubripirellula amarantea]|uniref:Macro domain-containing protein n=1 Tax=Rubripirellula amarantea TaxID=2527999 RepID=A0A5C5WAY6_9BACT|nr:hypothetical protein [Rubripirellula amarantea]TWT48018.1 hypothetical protein Pla22_50180 [Rubripirellula amarantea]
MTWFEDITGIKEISPQQVQSELSVDGDRIVCPNGNRIAYGRLETPKLDELRSRVAESNWVPGRTTFCEVIGDVRHLHRNAENAGALFQVASQFNLLEMSSPSVTPEQGVGIYENDHTQGPACAIACGAGTIYRNYFARVGDTIGQTAERQIDCSADLGERLANTNDQLWSMKNGYLFPTDMGLEQITDRLSSASETELEALRGELRIGLQWNAEVTLAGAGHHVSQIYCSGLPVAYGKQPTENWTHFAKLVLDATYEATICSAVLNASQSGVNKVFLTLVGGGVFGNRDEWIIAAIERAIEKYHDHNLDIALVSYGKSKPLIADLVARHK